MTAEDRRRRYELHRAFLWKVTGLSFGPAFLSDDFTGVSFRAVFSGKTDDGVRPIELVSVIREPGHFVQ